MTIPKIGITQYAYDWIMHATQTLKHSEIGGILVAEEREKGFVVLDTPMLVKQSVSAGGVDYDDAHTALAIERALRDNIDPATLRGNWHSHNSMGCFWSQTDEEYIQKRGQEGVPWLASIVVNTKREHKARLDLFDVPIVGHAFYPDCELEIVTDDEIEKSVKAEIAEWVEEKKWTASGTGGARFNSPKGGASKSGKGDQRDSRQNSDYGRDNQGNRWTEEWANKDQGKTQNIVVTEEMKNKISAVLPYFGLQEVDIDEEEDWPLLADMYATLDPQDLHDAKEVSRGLVVEDNAIDTTEEGSTDLAVVEK
jgi:hypothetical protein